MRLRLLAVSMSGMIMHFIRTRDGVGLGFVTSDQQLAIPRKDEKVIVNRDGQQWTVVDVRWHFVTGEDISVDVLVERER